MSQLLANISKPKRNKVELRIDQKFQIIEYQQKHPSLKQTELIKYFNKLFSVNIPATTMSGILSAENRNKILKQDNVESLNKDALVSIDKLFKYFEQKEDFNEDDFNALIKIKNKVDKNIENNLTQKTITEVFSKISVK